jgi:hypothetical protein
MARKLTTEDSETLRDSSSTAVTGGKGYTFADKVAAGFLVQAPCSLGSSNQSAAFATVLEYHFHRASLALQARNCCDGTRLSFTIRSRQPSCYGLNECIGLYAPIET